MVTDSSPVPYAGRTCTLNPRMIQFPRITFSKLSFLLFQSKVFVKTRFFKIRIFRDWEVLLVLAAFHQTLGLIKEQSGKVGEVLVSWRCSCSSLVSSDSLKWEGTKISIFRNSEWSSRAVQWLQEDICHRQTYFGENHGGNHCTPLSIISQICWIPGGRKKLSIAECDELQLIERVITWSDFSFLLWWEKGRRKLNRSLHNSVLKIYLKKKKQKHRRVDILVG